MIKLENKCGFYTASREQRKSEMTRGLGKKGTMSYEKQGCYICNGHNRNCAFYFNPLEEYIKGIRRGK